MNLGVLLPGCNRGGQSRFLALGCDSNCVEQVSRPLLGLFLTGAYVRVFVLLLSNGGTEFVRYPVKRIVESNSEYLTASVDGLKETGLHVPSTRNPLYVR